mmetsp:Transcript_88593/g.258949  ORF Transcript_88593/g.258949 Transcript_88593/m.258949 type:complete len:360 (+) Transcript_88593:89-1168(+)
MTDAVPTDAHLADSSPHKASSCSTSSCNEPSPKEAASTLRGIPSPADDSRSAGLASATHAEAKPQELSGLIASIESCEPNDWIAKMELLKGHVWELAAVRDGSLILQDLLARAEACHKARLARELRGHVNDAWRGEAAPHANHVLQKFVEVMPPEHCVFIHDELLVNEDISLTAHNQYGCRILERVIEHFEPKVMRPLLNKLLKEDVVRKLLTSRYGNYVLQHILEHGPVEQKSRIASVLLQSDDLLLTTAMNKFGSHVVQKAMSHCSEIERSKLSEQITELKDKHPGFKRSPNKTMHGSYVYKEAARSSALRRTAEGQESGASRKAQQGPQGAATKSPTSSLKELQGAEGDASPSGGR